MPTLKSVKSLSDRVLRGAPLTLRTRYRPPSSSPLPSSILVSLLRSPSSSPSPFSIPVTVTVLRPVSGTVLHPCLRNRPSSSFSALFSVPVSSTILHPRLRNRPPSSSPLPFSILVPGTVHHPRHLNRSPFPFTELFHRDYSALFIRFVSQSRSPQPSSVHVFSSVHHPRHLNHPPSSSPKPSFIIVT